MAKNKPQPLDNGEDQNSNVDPKTEPTVDQTAELSLKEQLEKELAEIADIKRQMAEELDKTREARESMEKKNATVSFGDTRSDAQKETDRQRWESKAERMKTHLAKQPKVTMYLPLEGKEKPGILYPVNLNGYRLNIPKGVYVDIPQQVADLLKESFLQTQEAGKEFRIDLDEKKSEKLL